MQDDKIAKVFEMLQALMSEMKEIRRYLNQTKEVKTGIDIEKRINIMVIQSLNLQNLQTQEEDKIKNLS